MRRSAALLILAMLAVSAVAVPGVSRATEENPFYLIYGQILLPNGDPVPDGTKFEAKNLDRGADEDNYMYNYTYSSIYAEGIYKVVLHDPSMPQSVNSMSYSDGDRILIWCNSTDGAEVRYVHVVDVSQSPEKRIDLKMEYPQSSVTPPEDEPWYRNPITVVLVLLVSILVIGGVIYLFVPPREE